MNQCDGCARRLPLKNGLHRGIGWDVIGCTKHRYPQATCGVLNGKQVKEIKRELDLIDKNAAEKVNK
jgi:hypothetical protein